MKKAICLACISFCFALLSFGQNVKLTNQTVSNERARTVYVGIDNVFIVNDSSITGIETNDRAVLNG